MDPDEQQKQIDEEVLALQQRIYELKIFRNGIARISRLPNELLVEIFFMLKDRSPITTSFPSWHGIAHVCRRWRDVALEVTCLWTNPPTGRQKYTLMMLERSGTAPLSIDMMASASRVTTAAIFNNIHRISTLVLRGYIHQLDGFQATLSSSNTALPLRDLSVVHSPKHIGSMTRVAFEPGTSAKLSSLESLTLENVQFDWEIFPIPSVTDLSLEHAHVTAGLPWKQFGAALNKMKLLRSLKLNVTSLRLHSPKDRIRLNLRHLRDLTLQRVSPTQLRRLLSEAKLPRLKQFYARLEVPWDSELPFTSISTALWSLYEQGNFRRLNYMVCDLNGVTLTKALSTNKFQIGFVPNPQCIEDFVQHIPRPVSLAITHLDIKHLKAPAGTLSVIFECLPNITTLTVSLSAPLVDALVVSPNLGIGAHIPLPLLWMIHVHGMAKEDNSSDFSYLSYSSGEDGNTPPVKDSTDVEALYRCLQLRRDHGSVMNNVVSCWCIDLSPRDEGLLGQFMKKRRDCRYIAPPNQP